MTGDEMQRAMEFLLKNQAHFEARFEESNKQWNARFEESNSETNRKIAQTNQIVEALAETQMEFTQTVLGFITSQVEFNTLTQKKFDALAEAQQRTQQEISDLTKNVNNLLRFSSGNGNAQRD